MVKVLEKNVAELIVIALFAMVLLSSCATSNCGPAANAWKTNCPAYR